MQLISLTSNKPSFNSVHFKNEIGLNIIVATQSKTDDQDNSSNTTNGVGKSLIVALIHFCLGSNLNKSFREHLPDWTFYLKFKINDSLFIAERNTTNQKVLLLNNEELSLTKFKTKLEELTFQIPKNTSELSFRSLIPFFIRPRKASYNDYKNPNAVKKDFQILMTNSLLLGLNVNLAQKKYQLKKSKDRIKVLINNLKDDELIKEFFNHNKDAKHEKKKLISEISILENRLEEFIIAEDYGVVNEEANKLKSEIDNLLNTEVLLKKQISNIDRTLDVKIDIKRESILQIYQDSLAIFNESALKQLEELETFYDYISKNRKMRLVKNKELLYNELQLLEENLKAKATNLDSKLKYLDTHHALDIVLSAKDNINDLKRQLENLEKYEELLSKYRTSELEIKKELSEESLSTEKYLEEAEDILNSTDEFFRKIVSRFYPEATSGITVENNIGDNLNRYNIEAKITSDSSDGINNIKIFCYDLTLLLKGFHHNINFMFHDSRLLSDTDPRQVAELFKIINEYINSESKQYIVTLNQNQLDDVKKYLEQVEYERIIGNNVCLQLKDDKPEEKLLGIQVDMKYD